MLDATPLLRIYARFRQRQLAIQDPVAVQERELKKLVTKGRQTRFGRDYGFSVVRSVKDFQARVPLRDYEAFWEDYWKADFPRLVDCTWPGLTPYLALTSGTTTGVTKYIPCSHEMMIANQWAAADLLAHHLNQRPTSRILGGRNFMLGGSTDLSELAPGVWSGDLSGIAANAMPRWARLRYFPPRELETIADWETKISKLAPLSLEQDIRAISGTPSWLLIFFDRLAEFRPGSEHRLVTVYPNLELLVHGGISFAPYRKRFTDLLSGSRAETREVYAASEGFIAVADRRDGEGLRLIVDNGLFYEFVPVDELASARPTRHWVKDLELGINYAIVVSSCAGLWAYVIGDTVTFLEREQPRLLVTGRTSYSLSAFGEHLIDQEIEEAIAGAAEAIGADITDYSVGALIPERPGELGQHLFVVEFAQGVPNAVRIAEFGRILDQALSTTNADYKSHRAEGFGLNAPRVHAAEPGSFARWMKSRGQLGGQHKVPRIINDPELFEALRAFTGCA